MRILQVVHGYPPTESGGVELLASWVARALVDRGHEVGVLARSEDSRHVDGTVSYQTIARVEVARIVSNCAATVFEEHYASAKFDALLTAHIRSFDPDVVHVQHTAGLTARVFEIAARAGYPVTLALHDAYFLCARVHLVDALGRPCPGPDEGRRCAPCLEHWDGADAKRRLDFFREMLGFCEKIFLPSRWLAQTYLANFPELEQKMVIEPPGVPIFAAPAARRPCQPLRLVALGSVIPEKGFHLIAEALRQLPAETACCRVFGWPVERARDYFEELEGLTCDGFSLMPPVSHEEIPKVLAEADAVVIPSICGESFSFVAREAFQAGAPVIAARSGALVEALGDGEHGILFDAGSASSLAEAIKELAEPSRYRRLAGRAGRIRPISEYAEALTSVWRELARPRPAFFSYADYEGRLRREEEMKERLRPYVRFFKGCTRVADLAAGGGVFLEMLKEAGVEGLGIDRSADAVRRMRQRGLQAIEADAVDFVGSLRGCDGVFVSHLLEHLTFSEVERLIGGIAHILPVSGVAAFILPNPESVRMHLFGFWRDPEHVRFYHPDLIDAVCSHYRLALIFSSASEQPFHIAPPQMVFSPPQFTEGIRERLGSPGACTRDEPPSFLDPASARWEEEEVFVNWRSHTALRKAVSRAFSRICSALRIVQVSSLEARTRQLRYQVELLRCQVEKSAREGEERDFALFAAVSSAIEDVLGLISDREHEVAAALGEFNQRLAVLAEALNRMWCWVDDAGLVYQKAGSLRVRGL